MRALALRLQATACLRFQARRNMSSYAFLFPGQGTQVVGMTKKFADIPSVAEMFRTAESVLGYDLKSLCLQGPQSVLDQTVHCQPAVVVASLAALESLKQTQPQMYSNCRAAAGFSVGEFTALIFAGSFSLEQGLSLIKLRAEVMQEACEETSSGMLTLIGLEEQNVHHLCDEVKESLPNSEISIANFLFPRGFVLSGSTDAITLMREKAASFDTTVKEVAVSGGFHSTLMTSAVSKLQEGLTKADISLPRLPVYSNMTGLPYVDVDEIRSRLAQQITKPVLWEGTIRNMMEREKGGGEGEGEGEGQRGERKRERKREGKQGDRDGGGEGEGEGKRERKREGKQGDRDGEEKGRVDGDGGLTFVEIGPGRQLRAMLKRIDKEAYKRCINFESSD